MIFLNAAEIPAFVSLYLSAKKPFRTQLHQFITLVLIGVISVSDEIYKNIRINQYS